MWETKDVAYETSLVSPPKRLGIAALSIADVIPLTLKLEMVGIFCF